MSVKTTFLNRDLENEVYISQYEGFGDNSGKACKIRKFIYGLEHAYRQWCLKFHKIITLYDFIKTLLIGVYTLRSMGVKLSFSPLCR
jgi:hypothetical protein